MSSSRLPTSRLTIGLPALIVIASVVGAGVTAAGVLWWFDSHARQSADAALVAEARRKAGQLDALLEAVRQDLPAVAGTPLVVRALDTMARSARASPPTARAALGTAPPDELDSLFRLLGQAMGYGDILFLSPQGDTLYVLATGADRSREPLDDAVRDAMMAAARARPAAAASVTMLAESRRAGPGSPTVALAGAPVHVEREGRNDLIGVLVVGVPRARVDAVLREGSSPGVTVLIGADGRLRSGAPGATAEDPIALPRAAGVGAAPPVTEAEAFGRTMRLAAMPLATGDLGWVVVAAEDAAAVTAPVHRMIAGMIGLGLAATLLLGWLASALAKRLARPVVALIERFDAALGTMPHGVVMIDAHRRLILCNAAYRALYDLPLALSKPGIPLATIDAYRRAKGMMPAEHLHRTTEAERRHLLDGRTIDIVRTPLPSGGYIAVHHNMTAEVRAQKQITYLATHDALTGLPNRASFGDRLSTALEQQRPEEGLAVLCLAIDHFKPVNDALGHPVGDVLLQAVASRLGDGLRRSDVLARLGGDEFVILRPAVAAPDEALRLAQRQIERIALPFEINGHMVVIGLSVGVAIAPTDGTDADGLIKNADLALHRAKLEGRGSARFFEPGMDAQLQARRSLELSLRDALSHGGFELAYQPLYDARTERVTGVEALLRWRHPERGLVPPAEFIPLAEERGLIVSIGAWVLERACADAAAWPSDIRIAVNLSAIQLKSPTLTQTIAQVLARTGLDAGRLELEITETVLLANDEATRATLLGLKTLGLRIALDDFGTGYSSLSYLRSFPFDKIKIDQSFVRELNLRTDAVAILKTITELGTTLGMTTTVEGVETWEQLQIVRLQGCNEVQGYFLCRPCGAAAITAMLQRRDDRPLQSA